MPASGTSDTDNDKARVRLYGGMIAGRKDWCWITACGRHARIERRETGTVWYHWAL